MKNPFTSTPFKSVMGVLLQVAPTAASLLPGGAITAPLAKLAISKLAGAVKKPTDAPAQEVADAISQTTDPDDLLAIKKADDELKQHLAELGISAEALAVQDTEGARQMQIARPDLMTPILAYGMVIFFFTFSVLTFFYIGKVAAAAGDIVSLVLGACLREVATIYGFKFGSSQGSVNQTATISEALKNATTK